ncbi:MAG TPA: hypothetical protein VGQ39_11410 [Pyrinomonadaceae bacterium]|jgi:uncharacterized membrane protein YagU involved in acid resistance|nr:hypothetical protein [Pyrinomonadaceae bacterium]
MSTTTHYLSTHNSKAWRVVFWGGLIAGTLDITGACVVAWLRAGVSPVRVFQSVASGIYGAASSSLGAKTAILGLVLHFLIATTWTVVYYLASRKISYLVNQTIIAGVLYGVVVYAFMNFVVIPLSAVPKRATPPPLSARIIGMSIIIFCIGLPIAIIVRKFSR